MVRNSAALVALVAGSLISTAAQAQFWPWQNPEPSRPTPTRPAPARPTPQPAPARPVAPAAQPAASQESLADAFRIPEELKADPEVQRMIREYNSLAGRVSTDPKKPNYCADKTLFGLRVFRIDGQPTVRFYVDGLGVGCLPSRLRINERWKVTRYGWKEEDHQLWQRFVSTMGNAVERGDCRTVDACMISSANILRTSADTKAFHYSDCADFPYYLRTYFSFRRGLPFSLAEAVRPRPKSVESQEEDRKINERAEELMGKIRNANLGKIEPFVIELPPPSLRGSLGINPEIKEVPGLTINEKLELKSLLKKKERMRDPRYSSNGNYVARRFWVMGRPEEKPVAFSAFAVRLRNSVSTATLRILENQGHRWSDGRGNEFEEEEPDFYSPALEPHAIVPGTVIYKVDGHTAIVYKINYQTGQIHYIDAHPDNTISYGVVDETWTKNMAGPSNLGGGFKNFRPIAYDQRLFGLLEPRARMAVDSEMGRYSSKEQFEKFYNSKVLVEYRDHGLHGRVNYLDFLRLRMSSGRYRIDPSTQFREDAARLCTNVQGRWQSVYEAMNKGIHLRPHPPRLPDNIWGAFGEWENYSTPGRDTVTKQRVISLIESLAKYRGLIQERSALLVNPNLSMGELKAQLLATWNEIGNSCAITYRNSAGTEQRMTLIEAIRRLPYMDYDPYMCPERRYGATAPGVNPREMATCLAVEAKHPDKAEWSAYQQFLRNRTEKSPSEPMGWTLDELKSMNGTRVDAQLLRALDIQGAIQGL